MEQCWRDVLQTIWELKGKDEEFRARLPPTKNIELSLLCCNQFLLSRAMVHKRPLHVWSDLLKMIAIQDTCHIGEPDYENLYTYNNFGKEKVGPEKPRYPQYEKQYNGYFIQGHTGEHLSHVIFGHLPFEMPEPTQEDFCQNFIKGCPGSPCQ